MSAIDLILGLPFVLMSAVLAVAVFLEWRRWR